jgi:hypothetical protein
MAYRPRGHCDRQLRGIKCLNINEDVFRLLPPRNFNDCYVILIMTLVPHVSVTFKGYSCPYLSPDTIV